MLSRKTKRRVVIGVVSIVVLVVATELVARWVLGLGDPPLSVAHPAIEYMFAPDQDRQRFGNRILINDYGMRSESFPKQKSKANELRIMVFGDSVINGGNLTDHAELATTIVKQSLAERTDRPVIVGNISAGSWGPPNHLAYLNEYGLFDADLVIVVVSSHDYADVPTFEPLDPSSHPTRTPWLATWEGMTRYLPRYLPWPGVDDEQQQDHDDEPSEATINESLSALKQFISHVQSRDVPVVVIQHWSRGEVKSNAPEPGHARIAATVDSLGVPVYQDAASLRNADDPFRDHIHLNADGQRALATLLETIARAHRPAIRTD